MWLVAYCWKTLDKGYNFALHLISIRGLHKKLWESQFREFRDSNLGVLGQNDIWVLALMLSTNNTIRGKVVASSSLGRGESCESMFGHGSSMHHECSNYALTNLLFSLCRFIWIIYPLITRPNPHPKAADILLPSKCFEPGSVPQLLILLLFSP
jgi:hypothetical protein